MIASLNEPGGPGDDGWHGCVGFSRPLAIARMFHFQGIAYKIMGAAATSVSRASLKTSRFKIAPQKVSQPQ